LVVRATTGDNPAMSAVNELTAFIFQKDWFSTLNSIGNPDDDHLVPDKQWKAKEKNLRPLTNE